MRCIIDGHQPQAFAGAGPYVGRKFDICIHCGATFEDGARIEVPGTQRAGVSAPLAGNAVATAFVEAD